MQRNPEHIYDELLVLRAQDGEVDAMNELVTRWNRPLAAHARCLINNEATAADALQDAWYDIVRTIGRLKDPAAYRVWMYRIVSRRCTDHLRRKMRRRIHESNEPVDTMDRQQGENDSAERNEDRKRLRQALAGLPGELRAMLALRYREDMPLAGIALVMNCPAKTVKSRLYEARQQLQLLLNKTD